MQSDRTPEATSFWHCLSAVKPVAQLPVGVPKLAKLTPVMVESGPTDAQLTVCAWSYSPVTPHVPSGYADDWLRAALAAAGAAAAAPPHTIVPTAVKSTSLSAIIGVVCGLAPEA